MEATIIRIAQLLLSLSILVIVHEFGHFSFAKLFKVRVEKFYLFFNPWFTLFKYKPKNSDTEYGIGWLPLGGYVKISGMIDESMDKEAMQQPPQPWEFRTKPAWQRLLIMVGGVLMNFILAFFIYCMVVFNWGENYIPIQETALNFNSAAIQGGFKNGDIILEADGKALTRYDDLDLFKIIDAENVTVMREGKKETFSLPENFKGMVLASKEAFVDITTTKVDSVIPGANADKAGILKGDRIIAINEVPIASFSEITAELNKYSDTEVAIELERNGERMSLSALVNNEHKLGFYPTTINHFQHKDYGFLESIPAGFNFAIRKLSFYILQLKLVFTKEGIQSLGGFGAIGSLFPPVWDWYSFWSMTAFLSIILGVMNLLPIPALDGGHVIFLLWEMITRRKPNEKFMEYAQMVGMFLLFALLIYANGMDIFRAFFK
ncbi:RIP metalloprotease RseP [Bacteroidales bacterium OttesenSCG-928-I14]|nr:RIP metalloprotease RseP [Bacteroidales bacterium OttesenSCG-928-I14]